MGNLRLLRSSGNQCDRGLAYQQSASSRASESPAETGCVEGQRARPIQRSVVRYTVSAYKENSGQRASRTAAASLSRPDKHRRARIYASVGRHRERQKICPAQFHRESRGKSDVRNCGAAETEGKTCL